MQLMDIAFYSKNLKAKLFVYWIVMIFIIRIKFLRLTIVLRKIDHMIYSELANNS